MMSVKAQVDKPAKAPAGDVETYYLEYYDRVYGFENLCVRSHVKSDFIFGNDGKVYIPNMFSCLSFRDISRVRFQATQ